MEFLRLSRAHQNVAVELDYFLVPVLFWIFSSSIDSEGLESRIEWADSMLFGALLGFRQVIQEATRERWTALVPITFLKLYALHQQVQAPHLRVTVVWFRPLLTMSLPLTHNGQQCLSGGQK